MISIVNTGLLHEELIICGGRSELDARLQEEAVGGVGADLQSCLLVCVTASTMPS